MVDSLNSSCFHLIDFSLSLIISCCLLLLGEISPFSSRAFRCVVKLLVCALSSFYLEALRDMSFPLRNAFIVSHKFGYIVASFLSNSKKSLIVSCETMPGPSKHRSGCSQSANGWTGLPMEELEKVPKELKGSATL